MAKERLISTRFWSDGWIRKINPLDRYFFLYLLTNEHTNISGVYELPISTIAYETGIDERDIIKSMFPRLAPKAYYKDEWVILTNFLKHQHLDSKTVFKGVQECLNKAPKEVLSYAKSINYAYGMDTLWRGYNISNLTKTKLKPNRLGNLGELIQEQSMQYYYDEDVREIRKKKNKISKEQNNFLISIGMLWVKMATEHFGIKNEEVPIKNIYYPIRACWEREKWKYKDFQELFKYFFSSSMKEDDKISFDLCMSEKFVAKYKISSKRKPVTNVSASNEIAL